MNQETIIENKFAKCCITGCKYEKGSYFEYDIYTAKPDENAKELALYVLLEHSFETMPEMLKQLMQEEIIPFGVVVFIRPGVLNPTIETGTIRKMRAEEFDQYGPEFSNFIIEELIPDVCQITGETLSSNPDMHFICGGSSGGLAAWNAVWFRNDYFHRAFLSSPTFSAMRGGEEAMVIARKTETKPIKLYVTTGTEEPDYYLDEVYEQLRSKYRPVLRIDTATMLPVYDETHAEVLERILERFNDYEDNYYNND